jgi:hypothetical protein
VNSVKENPVGVPSFSVGPIRGEQRDQVVDCLARNFPARSRAYWSDAFERISRWTMDQGFSSIGVAMEIDRRVVGVVLQIFSRHEREGQTYVRCNVSSWCVDKEYRAYAISLHSVAVKDKDLTYLNVTAAPHTVPFIKALGFREITRGQMFLAPALGLPQRGVRVVDYVEGGPHASLLSEYEQRVLADHAAMGCASVIALHGGRAFPFVFRPHRILGGRLPSAHLIFCRDVDEFLRYSGPIGRFLLFRFGPFAIVNVNERLRGVVGYFSPDKQPRFFRGPVIPAIGDLAHTELTLLEQ